MERIKLINRIRHLAWALFTVLIATGWVSSAASAQTLHTLVSFTGVDGEALGRGPEDQGGMVADAHGNLFGTTHSGGAVDGGTLFEIKVDSTTPTGYASTPITLVNFRGSNGAEPRAGLIADSHGNLFGTTSVAGPSGHGTVFELKVDATAATGYASAVTTLVSFNGTDSGHPNAGLTLDAQGNLFGTTANGSGTVFEVRVDPTSATGYATTETTLVSFDGIDHAALNGLILDAQGNLFGTARRGGASSCSSGYCGMVFEIKVDRTTATGYATSPTTLVNFNGDDGEAPTSLIFDAHGSLLGTTSYGGAFGRYGTVFEIKSDKTTETGYATTPTTLVSFNNIDGAYPYAGLILDAQGNLFGTTRSGEEEYSYYGTVFEIKVDKTTGTGYATTPTTLANLDGSNGRSPSADLVADAHGNLFGTAEFGGSTEDGTVFEVTDSGFVPPAPYAGTPGAPKCLGVSILALAKDYGYLARAATSLGFSSVDALLDSIETYCKR